LTISSREKNQIIVKSKLNVFVLEEQNNNFIVLIHNKL